MARRVRVVNINDLDQLDPVLYSRFVELLPIRSELDAQNLLAKMGTASSPSPLDVFLVDIDMSDNSKRLPSGLYWGPDAEGVRTALRPYGPELALPFLMLARDMVFVPYSNWWESPEVYNNGFVLLSCAFIFSRSSGKVWTLEQTREYICSRLKSRRPPSRAAAKKVEGANEESLVQEAEHALRLGLERLRQQLWNSRAIQLVNIEATCKQLEALDAIGTEATVPFSDPDSHRPICVEFGASGHWDAIEVSSLFADALGFRTEVGHRVVRKIHSALEELLPRSMENVGTFYDLAKLALRRCTVPPNMRLDKVIEGMMNEVHPPLSAENWQFIKRLAVIFAWVKAWKVESREMRRVTKVRQLLGFKKGERGATNSYNRLIRGGDGLTTGKGPWHKPLKRQHHDGRASDDFKLDKDQPEALTAIESRLSIQFAEDELEWKEGSPDTVMKYPLWMTEPEISSAQ